MKTLHFSATINAPKEKVWSTLWDDATYRKWTSPFGEGCYAVSDWKEGSPIQFLAPSGDGMYSEIAKLIPNEFMSFRHLGMMQGGQKQPESEESRKWAGAMETYTLKGQGNTTELSVSIDVEDQHVEQFQSIFPNALKLVKEIAEQ